MLFCTLYIYCRLVLFWVLKIKKFEQIVQVSLQCMLSCQINRKVFLLQILYSLFYMLIAFYVFLKTVAATKRVEKNVFCLVVKLEFLFVLRYSVKYSLIQNDVDGPFGKYRKIAIKEDVYDIIKRTHVEELVHSGIQKTYKEVF